MTSPTQTELNALLASLRGHPGVAAKLDIQRAARVFGNSGRTQGGAEVQNGDDAAAIADAGGYLLLAAEGMQSSFVASDPWFAGFSSVMVNLSDIAAMGGSGLAIVDVVFEALEADNDRLLSGMRDASDAYGVPIVGGHTGRSNSGTVAAVSVLGRAKTLLSSFNAAPGDSLLYVADLRGAYRGDTDNFNAATCADSQSLRDALQLLPFLAESQLVHAAKDVSMAGLFGTLLMLCEASGVGCSVDLDAIQRPPAVPLKRWLLSFPSYSFLLATTRENVAEVTRHFRQQQISCERIGTFAPDKQLTAHSSGQRGIFWDLNQKPLTGFSASTRQPPLSEPSEYAFTRGADPRLDSLASFTAEPPR